MAMQTRSSPGIPEVVTESMREQYWWLNEHALAIIPSALKRPVEDRAVDRFFVNWTLHPSNCGNTPGKATQRVEVG